MAIKLEKNRKYYRKYSNNFDADGKLFNSASEIEEKSIM